jgi:prepilin-type N-terminal cleavage/methylation domain-containing protein
MDKMSKINGFTLIELLLVIFIIGLMTGFASISWHAYAPVAKLNNTVQELAMALNLCRSKAILTGNNWFMRFDTTKSTYTIICDDGWLGTRLETDDWGQLWPARSYFIGSRDFSLAKRNNGTIDALELDRGPLPLGSGKTFLSATNVNQITYTAEGKCFNNAAVEIAAVWIALPEYLKYYNGNVMAGTADQRKLRRGIKVNSRNGMVEIVRQ